LFVLPLLRKENQMCLPLSPARHCRDRSISCYFVKLSCYSIAPKYHLMSSN
jgi:hypothetical protein